MRSVQRSPRWYRGWALRLRRGDKEGEVVEQVQKKTAAESRTRSIAFVALTVAITAVSAWVTVPLGPVPFTLQTMVLAFVVLLFPAREAVASVAGYVVLGALGVPVFSGMAGGLAKVMGPTGGFIIGFVLGAVAAVLVLKAWKAPSSKVLGLVREYAAAFAFLAISYVCGWAQLMAVAGMSPMAAFLAGIAPFILLDAIKIVIGVSLAHVLRQAVPALRRANA